MKSIVLIQDQTQKRVHAYLSIMGYFYSQKLCTLEGLEEYSIKISKHAVIYFACCDGLDIGMIAFYVNQEIKKAYITTISVLSDYRKQGIAEKLLEKAEAVSRENNIRVIDLEVNKKNFKAMNFYKKHDFQLKTEKINLSILSKEMTY